MAEGLLYLNQPKPEGSVYMGQVTPIGAPPNGRYSISGTLTNAQLLTMNSAPVEAVPAVAGKILIPRFIIFRQQTAVAYVNNRSVSARFNGIAVDLTTPAQIINTVQPQNGTVSFTDQIQSALSLGAGVDVRGLSIVLFGAGDTTGGDPANFVNWYLEYSIIDRP